MLGTGLHWRGRPRSASGSAHLPVHPLAPLPSPPAPTVPAHVSPLPQVRGQGAGLASAAIIAVVPSYISRSVAGSYDLEAVAIFALVFVFYLYVKASRRASLALHWLRRIATGRQRATILGMAAAGGCCRRLTPPHLCRAPAPGADAQHGQPGVGDSALLWLPLHGGIMVCLWDRVGGWVGAAGSRVVPRLRWLRRPAGAAAEWHAYTRPHPMLQL